MAWGETMYALDQIRSMLNIDDRIDLLENNEPKLIVASSTKPEYQPKGGLWLNINEQGYCNGFKIKLNDDDYSDFNNISLLSDYVFCDNGLSVKEIVNNLGNKIYIAKGNESMNVRTITNSDFKPVLGSKILVRFEAGLNSDTGLYFKIDDENGNQIIYKEVLSSSRQMDINGVNWVKVPIDKNSVTPNNLYEFLYTAEGFLWMNGGSVMATNESLGMVKGGKDISIDNEGEMSITSHKITTGSIGELGHVKVSQEFKNEYNDIGGLVPSYPLVSKMNDSIEDLPFSLSDNFITNGDFLINELHSEKLVCDAWIKESEIPLGSVLYDNYPSIIFNEIGSIKQYISNSNKLNFYDYSLFVDYDGYGKISILKNDSDIIQEFSLNSLNEEEGRCEKEEKFEFNVPNLNETDTLSIRIESLEIPEKSQDLSNLVVYYVDMKRAYMSVNPYYKHTRSNYTNELNRCSIYSNTTGEILSKDEVGINENLLINPSFKVCREEILYPVLENDSMVVDCWKTKSETDIEFWEEFGNIRIKSNSFTSGGYITQYITNASKYAEKYLTISCNGSKEIDDDDTISKFRIACYFKNEEDEDISFKENIVTDTFNCMTVFVPENTFTIYIEIGVPALEEGKVCYSRNIFNPKVEVGKTVTIFKENSYAKDLSLCLNYEVDSNCLYTSEISGGGTNENLLINSNFKINQRNFNHYYTAYGDTEEKSIYRCTDNCYQFGIDRWVMGKGVQEEIIKNSNGVIDKINLAYYKDNNKDKGNTFIQYVECPKEAKNNFITFSTLVNECTEGCNIIIGTLTASGVECKSDYMSLEENKISSCTIECDDNVDFIYVGYEFPMEEESIIKPVWTKLEIGRKATKYVAPDYESELVKCKRYFQIVQYDELGYFNLTRNFSTKKFTFPFEMRKVPIITIDSLKYDSYPFGNDILCVPSVSYFCDGITKDNFIFNYRTMSGGVQIGTTTLKRKDIGIYRDVSDDKTYFSDLDTRHSLNTDRIQVCGGSSLNNLYPREIDVQFLCDSEIRFSNRNGLLERINAYTTYNLTSNSNITTVSDKYNNSTIYDGYKSFDNNTNTYWRHAATIGNHYVVLDLKSEKRIHGFYLDDINYSSINGVGDNSKDIVFTISFSKDNVTWKNQTITLNGNSMINGFYEKRLNDKCVDARYVKFTINNKTNSSYLYFKNFYSLLSKQA